MLLNSNVTIQFAFYLLKCFTFIYLYTILGFVPLFVLFNAYLLNYANEGLSFKVYRGQTHLSIG